MCSLRVVRQVCFFIGSNLADESSLRSKGNEVSYKVMPNI